MQEKEVKIRINKQDFLIGFNLKTALSQRSCRECGSYQLAGFLRVFFLKIGRIKHVFDCESMSPLDRRKRVLIAKKARGLLLEKLDGHSYCQNCLVHALKNIF